MPLYRDLNLRVRFQKFHIGLEGSLVGLKRIFLFVVKMNALQGPRCLAI